MKQNERDEIGAMRYTESVTKGQPDKVCDQIADAIVDEYIRHDPKARVSIDVMGSHGAIMVSGEVTTKADFDVESIVKRVYREIGYVDEHEPYVSIERDAPNVLLAEKRGGANDTTVVTGYATSSTPEMLPEPLLLAHAIAKRLDDLRSMDREFSWLLPDGKVLVGCEGTEPRFVGLTVQHDESIDESFVRTRLAEQVIAPIVGNLDKVTVTVNQGGACTAGGFSAFIGLTGRKIACDTYGGLLPWGGGALSGKDPGKIDRCGAYMARYAAKWLVAKGAGKTVQVTLCYVRGMEHPVMVKARTGEGKDVTSALQGMDFRPSAILERLNLRVPRYRETACYGHFGRDFPWERIRE